MSETIVVNSFRVTPPSGTAKPCPFCGNDRPYASFHIWEDRDEVTCEMVCPECLARGGPITMLMSADTSGLLDDVIEIWNIREEIPHNEPNRPD